MLHWQHRLPVTTGFFLSLSLSLIVQDFSHTLNVAQMHFAVPRRVAAMPPHSLREAVDGCGRSGSFGGTAAAKLCARRSQIPH